MATFSNQSEHFYDDIANRSPRSFRGPQMNRQPHGRPDGYPTMPGMSGADNTIPSLRFGGNNIRDPFAPLSSGAANNMNFPYDMHAAQTWNGAAGLPPSFAANGINMTQNGDFGPNRGVKGSRGRPGVGNVSSRSP